MKCYCPSDCKCRQTDAPPCGCQQHATGNVQVELANNGDGTCEVMVFARSGRIDVNWTMLRSFAGEAHRVALDACLFAENTAQALGVECRYGNASLEKVGRTVRRPAPFASRENASR